jgi:hypothetical protein
MTQYRYKPTHEHPLPAVLPRYLCCTFERITNRVCSFSSFIFTIGGASVLVAQEVVCTALFTRSLVRL